MVLQRDVENPIWGWATPGEKVTVFARDQKVTATTDETGKWMIMLPPMQVGDPFSIRVNGAENEIEISNVLIGEVWICSGQSNMEWTVNRSGNPDEERNNANYPVIRHIKVNRKVGNAPFEDCETTGWQVCSPETAGEFTAVGYYFGRKLHKELNVPIGLINTSWGGTIVEAWTSADSLKAHPDFTERINRIARNVKNMEAAQAEFEQAIQSWQEKYDSALEESRKTSVDQLDDQSWKEIKAPGRWEQQGYRRFDGIAWYRKTVQLPQSLVGKELQLSLAMIDDQDKTFVNGKKVGETAGWNKPRKYTIPSALNDKAAMTITVQVNDTGGGGGIYGQASELSISTENEDAISLAGKWKFKIDDSLNSLPPRPKAPGFNGPNNPTALYNAMVHPLIPIQFKGVIWYQGESNASRAYQYRELFPLLIKDWRKKWNREFPFYWVQLANFRRASQEPGPSDWAELREAQSMTLQLPQTGEAVIIDIGDARDIHPKNKQDVGKRLAGLAMKNDYGFDMVSSGPRYREMAVENSKIRLKFDHANGLRSSDSKPLARFEIAGDDKKFVWATATIDGQDVVVQSDSVDTPVAVRYAWANNPEGCNLTNATGLPASPFRTDAWPGVTAGNK